MYTEDKVKINYTIKIIPFNVLLNIIYLWSNPNRDLHQAFIQCKLS
jgi:hypothetical protein